MLSRALCVLLAGASAATAQGTADAFVARIPAANIPSTVTVSAVGTNSAPGQTVVIPIVLSLNGGTAPGSFQADLNFDTTKLTFVSASGVSASIVLSTGNLRLAMAGGNPNGIASGVVGSVSFTVSDSFSAAGTAVNLVNCMSADPSGNPLSTGCVAASVGLANCAINGNGTAASIGDVQAMINQALGIARPANDLNQDGVVSVADIEIVLHAAMGGTCVY